MAAQQDVSRTLMAQKVGYTIDVLIDTVDGGKTVGRSQWDAPEIDGNVHLDSASGAKPGDIVSAKVVRSDEYDLWAVPS
jgi:ribosomal protein S12 methylthiotransferase